MAKVRMLFTGDVCFKAQQDVDAAAARGIMRHVKPIFSAADLRVMNLETPLAPEGVGAPIRKSGPNIIGRPENLSLLTEAGCDCAILANNHTKDYGEEALLATLELLDGAGMAHAGAGTDVKEAYRAWRTEKNGIRISVLAVCENEFGMAAEGLSGTAGMDMERLARCIREEKSVSDFVIVAAHGGCEFNPMPTPRQKERCRLMTLMGADAVIGGHTHCPQGYEVYEGKPIIYSMGNFLFRHEAAPNPGWHTGYMTELTLEKGSAPGVRVIPYRFAEDGSGIYPFAGAELDAMAAYIARLSEMLADPVLTEKYFMGWCAEKGIRWLAGLGLPPDYMERAAEGPLDCAPLYNLFSCEAHAEMMTFSLRILFEGRTAEAQTWRNKMLELQKMPV